MKESKELLIPAGGNCLYTAIILSYLLSVIDNQCFFRERVKHLSGLDQQFADDFRLKLLAKYNHPTNLHLSLSLQRMITALITTANIKENTWGGVEEIQKIALAFKLNILVYLDNNVVMGETYTHDSDRYVLENPVQPLSGALGTIRVLSCRACEAEIPNTKSKAELVAKIASAKSGEFQHYRLLDLSDGISHALYLGASTLNRGDDTKGWASTTSALITDVIPPVKFPIKLRSEEPKSDDENEFNDEANTSHRAMGMK
jgi:hypothetical protein